MGSIQSQNKRYRKIVNNDIRIIVTEPDESDEEEFFECSSTINEVLTKNFGNTIISMQVQDETKCDENEIKDGYGNDKETHSDSDGSSSQERNMRQQRNIKDFQEEINKKRVLRQQHLKNLRDELKDLRDKLSYQMMVNEQLREGVIDQVKTSNDESVKVENKNLKIELAECQGLLQKLNGENLNNCIENQALRDHVRSLKEVNKTMKEMLAIRETQVDQLKSKLDEIELSISDKETKILSINLKQEYQRQLENIRSMRSLYEERSNLLLQENHVLKQQIDDKEHELQIQLQKSQNLEEYVATLESNLEVKNNDIKILENQLTQMRSDKLKIDEEMNAVNLLISQILFHFNSSGSHINLDMLHNMLEENREFLKEMVSKENYGEIDAGSFLPKVLYELFLQVHNINDIKHQINTESKNLICTPEEIASKLPKVWKILIELLDQQEKYKYEEDEDNETENSDLSGTKMRNGPQKVLSVSKTFIKLRDLIYEKRSLQKDTTRLKTLYSHLEQRLEKQEKKLSSVSLELTKTWHLVGKIKRQNRQLHTHEQILCYQLQQKRRVLSELKAELEYCRKKWALARAINQEAEKQCQEMRNEFSMRRQKDLNSSESGFSDEHQSDGDENDLSLETKKDIQEKRFERNLNQFFRTSQYLIDSDRRRSLDLPFIYNVISEVESPARAQSEPPDCNFKDQFGELQVLRNHIFKKNSQASCVRVKPLENFDSSIVVITLPPDVHNSDKKILKHLKNNLGKEKKMNEKSFDKSTETAEQMFFRLNVSLNDANALDMEKNSDISVPNKDTQKSRLHNDDFLRYREERLSRLEAETKEFFDKMTRDKKKGNDLDNRLMTVHKNFLERQKEKSENSNNNPSTSTNNSENKKKDDDDSNRKDE